MNDSERLAVRSLARIDAVLLPIRDWSGHTGANRTIAMWTLHHGVALRVGGDAAARKSGERSLQEAVRAGTITTAPVGRSKSLHVRPTGRGALVARALAGLPIRGCLWALDEVAKRSKREPKTLDELWVDEIELNDGRGWNDADTGTKATPAEWAALLETEMNALPALAAGWLVADSTCRGHVRYAVAPAGWQEFDHPTDPPRVDDLPAAETEATDLYGVELKSALAALQTNKPDVVGEVGWYALPVSHRGQPAVRDDHPGFKLAARLAALRGRKR